MEQFQRGDQIAYIPKHARLYFSGAKGENWWWSLANVDVEFGFVTSQRGDIVFCRYWHRWRAPGELRTVANSEGTPADCLVRHRSVKQEIVEQALETIERVKQIVEPLQDEPRGIELPPFKPMPLKFFPDPDGKYD